MWTLGELRKIPEWIRDNRTDVLVVIGWTAAVTVILSRACWLFYEYLNVKFGATYCGWECPSLNSIDLLLLLASSFIAGIILSDVSQIIYGYLISMLLSSSITVISIFLYRWFIQGDLLAFIPYGWEYILYFVFNNVFWMMLPMGILCSFLGVLLGGLLKQWLYF
jgi:hypothetical protein